MRQFFPFAVNGAVAALLLPIRFRRETDGVTVDNGRLEVSYGLFEIATQTHNVSGAHVTRDYRWWTAIGPRTSRADQGLTFGTNHHAGVCIHFAKPVASPLSRKGHTALTVTVADLDGLVEALGYGEDSASS